jgi:hypothetical protein
MGTKKRHGHAARHLRLSGPLAAAFDVLAEIVQDGLPAAALLFGRMLVFGVEGDGDVDAAIRGLERHLGVALAMV